MDILDLLRSRIQSRLGGEIGITKVKFLGTEEWFNGKVYANYIVDYSYFDYYAFGNMYRKNDSEKLSVQISV